MTVNALRKNMNYKDCLEKGTENLERAGITEAKLDARLLLEYVCKTDHSTLFAHPDREVSDEEIRKAVEEQDYKVLSIE